MGKRTKNEWENNDSDFLQALYSVDIRLGQYLLAILFKQRYTSSVKSYKHLNKLIC